MKTKICTKCKKRKLFKEFFINFAYKDNYTNWCKKCCNSYKKKLSRKYPWKRFLKLIKQRCNNANHVSYKNYGGKGIKCLITVDELKELWFRDKAYEMNKPSIDRRNNDCHYEYDNCQFLELSENSIKRNLKNMMRSILQYDLDGNFIQEFSSITEAGQTNGLDISCLVKCVKNKRKSAGGFIWKYKNA